jgi:hypothetical protein
MFGRKGIGGKRNGFHIGPFAIHEFGLENFDDRYFLVTDLDTFVIGG